MNATQALLSEYYSGVTSVLRHAAVFGDRETIKEWTLELKGIAMFSLFAGNERLLDNGAPSLHLMLGNLRICYRCAVSLDLLLRPFPVSRFIGAA